MAKAFWNYSCGHSGASVERNRRQADYVEKTRAAEPCLDCARAARNEAARAANAASGLPALVGSPKQIAWAETVRHEFMEAMRAVVAQFTLDSGFAGAAESELLDALALLSSVSLDQTEAKWWIENGRVRPTAAGLLQTILDRELAPTVAAEVAARRRGEA